MMANANTDGVVATRMSGPQQRSRPVQQSQYVGNPGKSQSMSARNMNYYRKLYVTSPSAGK